MNLQQLKDAVKTSGGATLTSDLNAAAIDGGYMVSLQGHEIKTSIELLSSELLQEYKEIAQQRGAYVGLWMDGNDLYIDVSVNIQDQKQALKLARDNKQLAIYHIDKGESLYLNY